VKEWVTKEVLSVLNSTIEASVKLEKRKKIILLIWGEVKRERQTKKTGKENNRARSKTHKAFTHNNAKCQGFILKRERRERKANSGG